LISLFSTGNDYIHFTIKVFFVPGKLDK
jgi:hypothetical protein